MAASPARTLDNKLAIVTGASRGIGVTIAQTLAARGCNLVLNYTSPSSAAATTTLRDSLATQHGIQALVVQADMGSPTGPAELIAAAAAHFSPLRIDILIHNAGVALNAALPEVTMADFDRSYAINVRGPLLLTQAAEPHLPHDRSGRIVCLSSVSATLGFPTQSVYGGTKAALDAMVRTWARELAERCTVNAVNPGPVLTDMYGGTTPGFKAFLKPFIQHSPLMRVREGLDSQELVDDQESSGGRPAYPDEVAGVVAMLCSPEAAWVTGQVVSANGGMILGLA